MEVDRPSFHRCPSHNNARSDQASSRLGIKVQAEQVCRMVIDKCIMCTATLQQTKTIALIVTVNLTLLTLLTLTDPKCFWLQNFSAGSTIILLISSTGAGFQHRHRRREKGGVEGGSCPPPPNSGEKYFSGKRYCVIFGQLIYFWKKEEQAPFIF